jgi:hypothetical protein
MDPIITQQDIQMLESVKNIPAISMILPFEPKMTKKFEIELQLKNLIERVHKDMLSLYPAEQALPVLHKLDLMVQGLNYHTHKRSLALFVSPLVEKIFYLDTPVEEKLVVDESFQIRDLVYSKKQAVEYLILLLSGESSKTFYVNGGRIRLIKSNLPDHVEAYKRDLPQQVASFSDPQKSKQVLLDKFLHHMDEGLTLILRAFPHPVFVLGTERVLGHFACLTRNTKRIAGYVHGNYLDATEAELLKLMEPHVADWKSVRQGDLLHKLEEANNDGKLACGMHEVRKEVTRRNCRLLVVEKDFRCEISHPPSGGPVGLGEDAYRHKAYYITDQVDSLIETVLEFGGDVEFVDADQLKNYGQISLIKFY